MKSHKSFFVDQDGLLAYKDIKGIYIELKKFSDQIHTMRLTTFISCPLQQRGLHETEVLRTEL